MLEARQMVLALPPYMRQFAAVALAFFSAPIVPAVVLAVMSSFGTDLVGILMASTLFYFWALAFTVVLGTPVFMLAVWFDLVRLWSALLGGAVVGAAVATIIPTGMGSPYYEDAVRSALPLYTGLGAAAGSFFYLVLNCCYHLFRTSIPHNEP
jgi:hypothetical protein